MQHPQNLQHTILRSFAKPTPKAYTPKFRVAHTPRGWDIFDGQTHIGFILDRDWFAFDLWSFSPFEAPVCFNEQPPGKVVDLYTLRNTCINLPITAARELVAGVDDPFSRLKTRWVRASGKELDFEIAGEFAQGQRVEYHFRLRYDPQWARYRYFFDVDVWKLSFEGLEPINMMLAGALVSRPERMRWTHSVWEDPTGNVKRFVHSNALFTVTDYASNGDGQWRSKNAPFQGGWIAYAANPTFNPAMLIHETSAPVHFATCSQLFDEHLIWQRAGLDQLDEGFFHFVMRTELVNLDAKLAKQLLDRAEDPPKPKKWRFEKIALPFRMDVVNSFEKALDPWAPEDCPMLTVDTAADAAVRWVNNVAHTGQRSICLTGRKSTTWTVSEPTGAVCNVEPHTRYRFSAWVKTKNVERFARIELNGFEYTNANFIEVAHSQKLTGTCDWTLLQVEVNSGDEVYLMPRFVLYDTGQAWFDDAQLERIA